MMNFQRLKHVLFIFRKIEKKGVTWQSEKVLCVGIRLYHVELSFGHSHVQLKVDR
jgi:hypothetical protein